MPDAKFADTKQELGANKAIDDIFQKGIDEGASDIHFEPNKENFIVRFRIDGALKVVFEGDLQLYKYLVSKIKVIALCETTGLPRPQEGNIKYEYKGNDIDLRVSILPTSEGECVVVRVLERKDTLGDYALLGYTNDQITAIERVTKRPHGLILVTGPNGSGKSTTLFNILHNLNEPDRSLVTLEDPVERKIDMVRQTNIEPDIGLTFADGLRYLLRQDPDVIMVGEIRDRETAKIAVEASITGHLVLATIHTNNAAGAIVRLLNMGVEPYLLSSAIKFVSAQRLARTNCESCKQEYNPPEEMLQALGAPIDVKFYHSVGCPRCNQKGQLGRVGVHEILGISRSMQELIMKKPSDKEINELARQEGMKRLREMALQKVYDGLISIEEAIRLTE